MGPTPLQRTSPSKVHKRRAPGQTGRRPGGPRRGSLGRLVGHRPQRRAECTVHCARAAAGRACRPTARWCCAPSAGRHGAEGTIIAPACAGPARNEKRCNPGSTWSMKHGAFNAKRARKCCATSRTPAVPGSSPRCYKPKPCCGSACGRRWRPMCSCGAPGGPPVWAPSHPPCARRQPGAPRKPRPNPTRLCEYRRPPQLSAHHDRKSRRQCVAVGPEGHRQGRAVLRVTQAAP